MKSESIRKNLESEIVVSYTELSTREFKATKFDNTEMDEAIKYARRIEKQKGDSITYLDVELVVYNKSEEESNVVFTQSIPFNI